MLNLTDKFQSSLSKYIYILRKLIEHPNERSKESQNANSGRASIIPEMED